MKKIRFPAKNLHHFYVRVSNPAPCPLFFHTKPYLPFYCRLGVLYIGRRLADYGDKRFME